MSDHCVSHQESLFVICRFRLSEISVIAILFVGESLAERLVVNGEHYHHENLTKHSVADE